MSQPAGAALIGAGFVSYFHLFASRAVADLRVVALASQSARNAEHRARIFGVDPYRFEDLDDMLAREDVDFAIVASPNVLHFEHAMMAVRAGCHLILEKPMVLRLEEADKLVAAAEDSGVFIGYAENHVFSPLLVRMREAIEEGTVGEISRVRGSFHHGGPARGTWWYKKGFSGGGAQVDLGAHVIEGCLYLAGKPQAERVRWCRVEVDPDDGLDRVAACALETANGVDLETESSWRSPEMKCFYEVEGAEGTLVGTLDLGLEPNRLVLRKGQGREALLALSGGSGSRIDDLVRKSGYVPQLAHFSNCFRSGTDPEENGKDGLNVLRILAASYLSAASRKPVDLSSEIPDDKAPIELLAC
jgi:predicted dehydrogenase